MLKVYSVTLELGPGTGEAGARGANVPCMHIYVATPDASLSSDGDRTVTAPLRTEGPAGRLLLLLLLLQAGAWWTRGRCDGRA